MRRRPARLALALLGAAVLAAGCGYTGSRAEQVGQWARQNHLVTDERQVIEDADSLELAMAKGTALQLRTVCGGLSSDAGTLYTTLDAPDHLLTDQIAAATEDFFHAAERCAVAPSITSPGARRALVLDRAGLAELGVVNRDLAGLHVAFAPVESK